MIFHFLFHCLHEIVEGNPSQTFKRIGTTGRKIDQNSECHALPAIAFALHSPLEIFSNECSRDFYWLIIQFTVPIEQNLADSNLTLFKDECIVNLLKNVRTTHGFPDGKW